MFSFEDYKEIIRVIQSTDRYMDYHKAIKSDKFILMRHDVEYSVERAYDLAKVESSMNFTSTYFFQWTNNTYNILSKKNKELITDMHERGHHIGLHFALNGLTNMKLVREQIQKELNILNEMFEFKIDTFSIHRPSREVLAENIKFDEYINAYQDDFFTFADNVTEDTPVAVKYLSDANHAWRYGYPDEKNILENDKVQILTHPFAWCKEGYDNFNNYKFLVNEKYVELINGINNECKDFIEYKDWFLQRLPIEK